MNVEQLVAILDENERLRPEVERLREALDAIYAEANDGTDDAHRRLCNIMKMVAKTGRQGT